MAHGDYRRESFHCEHSLQSLLEMEGENGPAPPSPSSSSSPSPPLGGETGGLKPLRRLGRQESPLSRDTLVTVKEKDNQNTKSEPCGLQTESKATNECKTSTFKSSKSEPCCEIQKTDVTAAEVETKSSPAQDKSNTEAKPGLEKKPQNASSSSLEATGSKSKVSEKTCTPGTSQALRQQESKQQRAQPDNAAATKAQEKAAENLKGTLGKDKVSTEKESSEQTKPRKGTDVCQKGGISSGEKTSETTKVKGPAPPAPNQVQSHTPAGAKTKVERASHSNRGAKEERVHLEVLEENPVLPSSNAASPCSSKARPMSPGDKASFVTQLTSVAKTVLGPMKGTSQEGARVKDASRPSEDKRGNTMGKAEASTSGGRRGAQTGTSASSGSVQLDKGNSRSSKHHS